MRISVVDETGKCYAWEEVPAELRTLIVGSLMAGKDYGEIAFDEHVYHWATDDFLASIPD
jgi:hypothetical protein